jgi:predicted outer membrane repeat protein
MKAVFAAILVVALLAGGGLKTVNTTMLPIFSSATSYSELVGSGMAGIEILTDTNDTHTIPESVAVNTAVTNLPTVKCGDDSMEQHADEIVIKLAAVQNVKRKLIDRVAQTHSLPLFPFSSLPSTSAMVRRRLSTVLSWAGLRGACSSDGTIELGDDFVMGSYTGGCVFTGKSIVVECHGKTLDAGYGGRFFYALGRTRHDGSIKACVKLGGAGYEYECPMGLATPQQHVSHESELRFKCENTPAPTVYPTESPTLYPTPAMTRYPTSMPTAAISTRRVFACNQHSTAFPFWMLSWVVFTHTLDTAAAAVGSAAGASFANARPLLVTPPELRMVSEEPTVLSTPLASTSTLRRLSEVTDWGGIKAACGVDGTVELRAGSSITMGAQCIEYDNWRKAHGGSHVDIALTGQSIYGAVFNTWGDCYFACKQTQVCKQVVYQKSTGGCYGMNEAKDPDSDSKGGTNTDWISGQCSNDSGSDPTCDFSGSKLIVKCNGATLNADHSEQFFYGNGDGSSLSLHGCIIKNGKSSSGKEGVWYGGGAISAIGASVKIYTCSFVGNIANMGGAICVDGGLLTIINTTFQSNTRPGKCTQNAATHAAKIFEAKQAIVCLSDADCPEHHWCGDRKRGGGAVYADGAAVEIYSSSFKLNRASNEGGTLRVCGADGTLDIYTSTFDSNSATAEGGAIYVGDNAKMLVKFCRFEANDVRHQLGGAIHTNTGTTTEIEHSTFNSNTGGFGGAIFVRLSEMEIQHTSFTMNTASQRGGAFGVFGSKVVMHNCNIERNKVLGTSYTYWAIQNGHALYTHEVASHNSVELHNVTFSEPDGGMGGKHLIHMPAGAELDCTKSTQSTAYPSLVMIDCSARSEEARRYAVLAEKGAVAVYRSGEGIHNLTTSGEGRHHDPDCDATASFRWIHSARSLACICEAGNWRSQEQRCVDLKCTSLEPLKCSVCPQGYYAAEDASKCSACGAGTHQPEDGSIDCLGCTAGHYQESTGQVACTKCKAGTYQSHDGRSHCTEYDNWRKNTTSAVVLIGQVGVGGTFASWAECYHACKQTQACKQVVYKRSGDHALACYGMNAARDEDADSKGGTNTDWVSGQCTYSGSDWSGETYCPLCPAGSITDTGAATGARNCT